MQGSDSGDDDTMLFEASSEAPPNPPPAPPPAAPLAVPAAPLGREGGGVAAPAAPAAASPQAPIVAPAEAGAAAAGAAAAPPAGSAAPAAAVVPPAPAPPRPVPTVPTIRVLIRCGGGEDGILVTAPVGSTVASVAAIARARLDAERGGSHAIASLSLGLLRLAPGCVLGGDLGDRAVFTAVVAVDAATQADGVEDALLDGVESDDESGRPPKTLPRARVDPPADDAALRAAARVLFAESSPRVESDRWFWGTPQEIFKILERRQIELVSHGSLGPVGLKASP